MTGFAEPGASRDGYGDALLDMAGDERVVVLEADLGKSTKSCHFRAEYPERTFCLGIAEQNMALVGAGLAEAGKVPFASTFAIFSERAFEQFRNGIARTGLVVHLCGSHGGMHTGQDGSSAQSTEDLGIFRTLPEVTVMTPCDRNSSRSLTKKLLDHPKPSYTRTARNKTREIYTKEEAEALEIGKASVLREGADASIIACGVMVERALEAADRLAERGSRPRSSTCTPSSQSTGGHHQGCKQRCDRDGRGPLRDWRTRIRRRRGACGGGANDDAYDRGEGQVRGERIPFRHHGQDGSDIREHRIESRGFALQVRGHLM